MKRTERYRKAREYLERVQKADNRTEKLEMRLKNLRILATDTANHLNGGAPGGKADGDRIGRITAEIADTEGQITAAKEETERIRLEVRAMISQIKDPMSQKTIMLYYLENQTLQEISKEICYSRTQTFRLLETGLAEIERMLPYEKWNMMEHDGMQWNAME